MISPVRQQAPSADASLLVAEDVHKTYTLSGTSIPVLKGAGLRVEPGESLAIVGVSGAGKSTLLHVLGGLDRPDSGRVMVDGQDLYRLPASRRTRVRATQIGFVFQSYHLLPEMDVLENVSLPAMARGGLGTRRTAVRNRARELLAAVGLEQRAAHRPMELSGGEQQRVALARALMNDPRLVLADEPTGNLDSGTGKQVLDSLFALTARMDHALVLVTHNEDIAGSCGRIMRLEDGLLVPA